MEQEIICQKCGEKIKDQSKFFSVIYAPISQYPSAWINSWKHPFMSFFAMLGFPVGICHKCGHKNNYPLRTRNWNMIAVVLGFLFILVGFFEIGFVMIVLFGYSLYKDSKLRKMLK